MAAGWTTDAVSSRSVSGDTSLLITPQYTLLVGFYDSGERQFRLASGASHGAYLPLVIAQ